MPYIMGTVFGLAVVVLATRIGFDRDRAFYPVLLIDIANPVFRPGGPASAKPKGEY